MHMEQNSSPIVVGYIDSVLDPVVLRMTKVALINGETGDVHPVSWAGLEALQNPDRNSELLCELLPDCTLECINEQICLARHATKIMLLVNSQGGNVKTGNQVMRILDSFHYQSTSSEAYGTERVCSMATSVFAHVQKRYALEDTTFLFHGTSSPAFSAAFEHSLTGEKFMEDVLTERRQEMEKHKVMLLRKIEGKARKRIEWAFNIAMHNPENRLLDAYFRGEDLEGFMDHVYLRRRDLWNCFVRNCGFGDDRGARILDQFKPFFLPQTES